MTPYLSLSETCTRMMENSDDVVLNNVVGLSTEAKVDAELGLGKFRRSAAGACSKGPAWSVKVGGGF